MNYRREIDGLRAIAVLSVILFHAGFPWVSGGFVGVDVFFVISGYLITGIILSECEAGTFTLAGFYERRVRRILPALFFILLCSLPAAYILFFPGQMTNFSRSFISGLFFISNVYFRNNLGYFDSAAEEEPLLHLWSLAVEEQYYIFFPLLVIVLWRGKKPDLKAETPIRQRQAWGLVAAILLISVASFIYAENIPQGNGKIFYDTRGRVWELFIGSLTAIYLRGRKHSGGGGAAECGSALGLFLIFGACFGIDKKMPFPGHWALLPTLGAALILVFASPRTLAGRLLSTPVLVGVGLISYSAYLWHWPLFVFARIIVQEPSLWLFAGLSVLSLGLAFVSWRYVECPFRDRRSFKRPQIFRFAAFGAVLLVITGLGLGFGLNGNRSRFNAEDADLLVSREERARYVSGRYNQLKKIDQFSNDKKPRVLLLGDSYSQDFMNIMAETGILKDAEIRVRYIPARCQIYHGKENGLDFLENDEDRANCVKDVYHESFYPSLQPLIQSADIIIFAASWREFSALRLSETINNLHIPDSSRVVVIGNKDFGKIRLRNYISLPLYKKAVLRNSSDNDIINVNKILRGSIETISDIDFIDLHGLICGVDSKTCPIFSPEGKLLSFDGSHLTQAGAAYIGGLLKEHPVFRALESGASNRRK